MHLYFIKGEFMRIIMKGITVRTGEDKMSFSISAAPVQSPARQTLNEFFMNQVIPSCNNERLYIFL